MKFPHGGGDHGGTSTGLWALIWATAAGLPQQNCSDTEMCSDVEPHNTIVNPPQHLDFGIVGRCGRCGAETSPFFGHSTRCQHLTQKNASTSPPLYKSGSFFQAPVPHSKWHTKWHGVTPPPPVPWFVGHPLRAAVRYAPTADQQMAPKESI